MLNVKQILDEGLLLLENAKGKPAQVGYDLSLKSVQVIGLNNGAGESRIGKILKDRTEI